jgi:hypothetical protein
MRGTWNPLGRHMAATPGRARRLALHCRCLVAGSRGRREGAGADASRGQMRRRRWSGTGAGRRARYAAKTRDESSENGGTPGRRAESAFLAPGARIRPRSGALVREKAEIGDPTGNWRGPIRPHQGVIGAGMRRTALSRASNVLLLQMPPFATSARFCTISHINAHHN